MKVLRKISVGPKFEDVNILATEEVPYRQTARQSDISEQNFLFTN